MATPSRARLEKWAENYVALWNAGDKQGWIDNWRSVAPGDFRMLDPVGTPEKRGFEECCANSFDLFQPKVHFKIAEGTLFICDNEVAWLLENHIETEKGKIVGLSIETYRFEANGDVNIRTYYKVPQHSEAEMGELFQTYLPDDG